MRYTVRIAATRYPFPTWAEAKRAAQLWCKTTPGFAEVWDGDSPLFRYSRYRRTPQVLAACGHWGSKPDRQCASCAAKARESKKREE